MATSDAADWQTIVGKHAPELLKQVTGLREVVMTEGALSIKTKTLMTMLCDALLPHPYWVATITNTARPPGPS